MSSKPDIVYVGDAKSSPHIKLVEEMIARDWGKMRAELGKFNANADWAADNRGALRKDYAGAYIAVRDKKVCASDGDLSRLLEKIKDGRGNDVFIDHVEREDADLLFAAAPCDSGAFFKNSNACLL